MNIIDLYNDILKINTESFYLSKSSNKFKQLNIKYYYNNNKYYEYYNLNEKNKFYLFTDEYSYKYFITNNKLYEIIYYKRCYINKKIYTNFSNYINFINGNSYSIDNEGNKKIYEPNINLKIIAYKINSKYIKITRFNIDKSIEITYFNDKNLTKRLIYYDIRLQFYYNKIYYIKLYFMNVMGNILYLNSFINNLRILN